MLGLMYRIRKPVKRFSSPVAYGRVVFPVADIGAHQKEFTLSTYSRIHLLTNHRLDFLSHFCGKY